jgi:type VI secretion system protein ImpI
MAWDARRPSRIGDCKMTLRLRIENVNNLADGGPIEYSVNQSGFEIGRDTGMDWTLPDPNRFVSSCHIEIRFENGGYFMYDVSTNGTFVNGSSMRVKSPYQLQQGDKLQIGHYLVVASMDQSAAESAPAPEPSLTNNMGSAFTTPPSSPPSSGGDIWSMGSGGAPAGAGDFDPTPRSSDRMPDFGDQHISTSEFGAAAPAAQPTPPAPQPESPFGAPPAQPAGSPFGEAPAQPAGGSPFGTPPAQPAAPAGGSPFGEAPTPAQPQEEIGSPFGAPAPAAEEPNPFAPQGTPPDAEPSPFGAPEPAAPSAPPATPDAGGSPFGNAAPAGAGEAAFGGSPAPAPYPPRPTEGSPFGDPQHTKPPEIPPAQVQPPQQPPAPHPVAPPPAAEAAPQSEAFAAPPQRPKQAPPAPAPNAAASDSDVLKAICEGAGMRPDALSGVDAGAVAYEIGQSLRIVAAELAGLLRARAAAKQMVKSGSRTMVGHDANNPMKFIPTAGEALEVMFGPGRPGYQRGAEAIQSSFNDLKKHQYAVHAAIQPALAKLLEDLSPESVEDKVEGSRFSSKGAKAWEVYVERWDAKTHPYENGMLDVFLAYFADAYDDAANG